MYLIKLSTVRALANEELLYSYNGLVIVRVYIYTGSWQTPRTGIVIRSGALVLTSSPVTTAISRTGQYVSSGLI